jgi:UDP-galactopyranose mutase
MPEEIVKEIHTLKHTSVNITYYGEEMDNDAQWIYYPDMELSFHRILLRKNFIDGANGYWTETNSERYDGKGKLTFYNEYAYPLNTIHKRTAIHKILEWCSNYHVIGLGRWGEWEHYNSDVTVDKAIRLAQKMEE